MDFDQEMQDLYSRIVAYIDSSNIVDGIHIEICDATNCPNPSKYGHIHMMCGIYDEKSKKLVDKSGTYSEFSVFIHPTYDDNINDIKCQIENIRNNGSGRYSTVSQFLDNNDSLLVFSILHEIGHCVYINKVQEIESCCPGDVVETCLTCPYRFLPEKVNCNLAHELNADKFALDHILSIIND